MPEPIRCRHIHIEGRQCGSPALRNEKLCYHHHAALRPLARRSGDPLGPILPDPEDLPAVQRGLAELLRLVARDLIDAKQAKRLFTILTEAGTNLARLDRARARQRTLALAEARLAAKHPEAAAAYAAGLHTELVQDLVNDPELGAIAPPSDSSPNSIPNSIPNPRPDAEPQTEPQSDAPTPDLLPISARDSPADEHARILRDQAAAAEQAEFDRQEEEYREERRSLHVAALTCQRSNESARIYWDQEKQKQADAHTDSPTLGDHPLSLLEC